MGKRLLFNKGILFACLCVAVVRILQIAAIFNETGSMPTWDRTYVDFNNTYVGMFVAAPCLICAMYPFCSLIAWDKMPVRFVSRDDCFRGFAKLAALVAVTCSAWMSLVTILALLAFCSDAAIVGYVVLLVAENSAMQMVFFVACACLFLAGVVLSGSGAIASVGVFLYVSVDLIVAGIPYVSQWFPALGWAIVQIANPYDFVPLAARAAFPLLLAAFSSSVALLAYRRRDFVGKADIGHDI